jgi:hypothetical protein
MMDLVPRLRKLKSKFVRENPLRTRYLLEENIFRVEAARERVRADRSSTPLAILVIELPSGRSTRHDFLYLSGVLERRLRITDTAGMMPEQRVGVLLPDTPFEGAWKVASDICDVYPVGHDRPGCEVYVYPVNSSPDALERDRERQPAGGPASQFDALFVEARR